MGSGKSKAKEAEARRVAEEARVLQEQEQQQQALYQQQQQEQQQREREQQEREQKEREQQEREQKEREQKEQQEQEAMLQRQQQALLEQERLEVRRRDHRPGTEEVVAQEDTPPRNAGTAAQVQEIQPAVQSMQELPTSPAELDGRNENNAPKLRGPQQEETLALDTEELSLSPGTTAKASAKDSLQPLGPPKMLAELPALGVGGGGNFGRPSLPGLSGLPKAPAPLVKPGGRLAEPVHKGPEPDRLIAEIEALTGGYEFSEQAVMDEAASLNLGMFNHNPTGSSAAPNRRGPGSVHSHVSVNGSDTTISASLGGSSRAAHMTSVSAVQYDHMGSRPHNDPSSVEPELVYPSQKMFSQEEQRRKRSIPGFDNEAFRRANQKTKPSWSDPSPKGPSSSGSAVRNDPSVSQVTSTRATLDRKDEDLMDAIELSMQEDSLMRM